MLQNVADSNIRHVLLSGRLVPDNRIGVPILATPPNRRGFLTENLTKCRMPCVLALEAPT
jgi:hypothetical protein